MDEREFDEYIYRQSLMNIQMEYDPDKYNPEELKLVYKHCDDLYTAFKFRLKHNIYMQHAVNKCNYWLQHQEEFKELIGEVEYNRLRNELSYIRFILDL